MEASPTEERWKKVSTLLIDGRRLYREVPDKFFDPMQQLQVLVIFNPTFRSLPSSLSKMGKLLLLVLRGCDPLENIDPIKGLESFDSSGDIWCCLLEEYSGRFFPEIE
jgi:hypothetical protein